MKRIILGMFTILFFHSATFAQKQISPRFSMDALRDIPSIKGDTLFLLPKNQDSTFWKNYTFFPQNDSYKRYFTNRRIEYASLDNMPIIVPEERGSLRVMKPRLTEKFPMRVFGMKKSLFLNPKQPRN